MEDTRLEVLINDTVWKYSLSNSGCQGGIHGGANYSIRVRALNHQAGIASNFSDPTMVTTRIKGT